MTKITAEHLARSAYVYIRQSTPDQLAHNHESRRRQYTLADRARQLGWTTVEIVDDDLGRSGGGIARPGFDRLIGAVCAGGVGAVLAIEASRLARNGRDWHMLIEFCGLLGTILVDEDGIYDPRHPNDRLLLGMKGTMSELELSLFRQRSQEALRQKARRGALFLRVAAGYVKVGRDRIEKDPNQRVQDALKLLFAKFAEFHSARQVHIWLRDEGIDAAVKAIEAQSHETTAAQRQHELALRQARYEAAHARRQYDAVDPANRLVAGELERRWNAALENVQRIEREMAASAALRSSPLGEQQKQQLMALGADLECAWSHPAATAATRKRILRACLDEIVVRKDGAVLDMVLRWHGGDHTALKLRLKLNARGRSYNPVTDNLIALVRELARLMPDRQIARLLNRSGTQMATGKAWTEQSIRGFRKHHDVAAYRDGEWSERGEITLEAAAKIIGVCKMTALRMLRRGDIKGRQICPGAPWVVKAADLASLSRQARSHGPVTPNGAQQAFDFQ